MTIDELIEKLRSDVEISDFTAVVAADQLAALRFRAIAAESKLSDLRSQAWECMNILALCGNSVDADSLGVKLQDAINNSQPVDAKPKESSVQRITEQDARHIIACYQKFHPADYIAEYLDDWISASSSNFKGMLDKLNEHRQPEVKAGVSVKPVAEITSTHTGNSDGQFFNVNWLTTDFKVGDKLYLHPQVTANKTEAPLKEDLDNIINVERLGDQSIKLVFSSCRAASSFYTEALEQLPPLKDGDK